MKADTDMNKLPCEDTLGVHEPPCSGALRNMFLFWFLVFGSVWEKIGGYEVVPVVLCCACLANKIVTCIIRFSCFYFSP